MQCIVQTLNKAIVKFVGVTTGDHRRRSSRIQTRVPTDTFLNEHKRCRQSVIRGGGRWLRMGSGVKGYREEPLT